MNDEQKKEILSNLIHLRMRAKSRIEEYRFLSECSGRNYQREINRLLDRINDIDDLIRELEKK